MSRRQLLLSAWGMLVLGLAIRALATGLLADRTPRLVARPLVVEINLASVEELQALPGVGPTRAMAIVLERVRHGPFRRLADLQRVDGIGDGVIDAMGPFVGFAMRP